MRRRTRAPAPLKRGGRPDNLLSRGRRHVMTQTGRGSFPCQGYRVREGASKLIRWVSVWEGQRRRRSGCSRKRGRRERVENSAPTTGAQRAMARVRPQGRGEGRKGSRTKSTVEYGGLCAMAYLVYHTSGFSNTKDRTISRFCELCSF